MNLSHRMEQQLPRPLLELVIDISTLATGRSERVYLVGGIVRDLLLQYRNLDIDLVVEGDAVGLARNLAESGKAELLAQHHFGTATLKHGEYTVDMATARKETYAHPGALPEVAPGTIRDDLARRDFSINAMAVSLSPDDRGELIDLHGGRADLEQRLIRILHPGSFRDDATRILRGVRYEQRLGFEFEEQTAGLLRRDVPMLDTISGDRIRNELELILREKEPEHAIRRLADLGALSGLGLTAGVSDGIDEMFGEARKLSRTGELSTLYFCLLVHSTTVDGLEAFVARLNMSAGPSRAMRDTLRLKNNLHLLERPSLKPSEVYGLLQEYGAVAIEANAIASRSSAARGNLERFLAELRHVKPSLNGEDLKKLGIPPGPEMGRILSALRRARLDGEVDTRAAEERLARSLLAGDDNAGRRPQRE
ncbi:MAG: CCA tRNA nucleotidyltransferase [Dehalococcoidia bacterium]